MLVTGRANLKDQGLVVMEDWGKLQQAANLQAAVGLKEANPLDSIITLKPTAWGAHGYDKVSQMFSWELIDSEQQSMLMEVGFEEFTEPAI